MKLAFVSKQTKEKTFALALDGQPTEWTTNEELVHQIECLSRTNGFGPSLPRNFWYCIEL